MVAQMMQRLDGPFAAWVVRSRGLQSVSYSVSIGGMAYL
jgi:hypothetical protein